MRRFFRFVTGDLGKILLGGTLFAAALIIDLLVDSTLIFIPYLVALLASGYSVIYDAISGLFRRDFLGEKLLMTVAAVGAFLLGEYAEGVAVILFFLVGEYFEHKAVRKSRSAIKALMDICPDEVSLLTDSGEELVDIDDIGIGDRIVIRAGQRVGVDCLVLSGSSDVDTSALTGESAPVFAYEGDKLYSGSVLISGAVTAEATADADGSSARRIISLAQDAAERKSREESFITAFSRVYTPLVVGLALLMAILPSLLGLTSWQDSIYRALSFLVISCPCALVISVPMAFFAGIGRSASRGILYKGSSSFSPISKVRTAVFDKTGTLTLGKFKIDSATPEFGVSIEELLSLASLAEYASDHPIARAIKAAAPSAIQPDESGVIAGKGAYAKLGEDTYSIGNSLLMAELGIAIDKANDSQSVYLARQDKLLGRISLSDTVKPDAEAAINALRALGVKRTVMLSGDKSEIAKSVGARLAFDEVYSELLPEQKYEILTSIIDKRDGKTMYIGDGINDTPSLSVADVGVAMGAIGADSAKECADLIIMGDRLTLIPEAIKIASKTLRIAKQNIVFAIGAKVLVLILSAFGLANMWLAVFADVGVCIIAVLNSMRMLINIGKSKDK